MRACLGWAYVAIGLELVMAGVWACLGDYSQAIALGVNAVLQSSFVVGVR